MIGLQRPTYLREGKIGKLLIPIDLRPQQKHILENLGTLNVVMAHRRFGKSVALILKTILSFLTVQKNNPVYWYVLPELQQAENNVWQYFKDFTSDIPGVRISETELSISVNLGDGYGTRLLKLVGVDKNAEAKRGAYLDGCVIDEMGQIKRGVWESVIMPMIMDRDGWVVLTGTPAVGYWQEMVTMAKESPHWKVFEYSDVRETKLIDPAKVAVMEAATEDLPKFRREMYGEWITGDIGSYYLENLSKLRDEGKISESVVYNPKKPVIASWDLGLNDLTVVWFAQYYPEDNTLKFFDYWEKRGVIDYRHALQDVELKGYKIDLMVLPHDASKRTGTGDDTVKQVFEKQYKVLRIPKTGNKLNDISIIKNCFHTLEFNSYKCAKGITALYNYRSALNKKTDQLSLVPMHCDRSDSFRYMILGLFQSRWSYTLFASNKPKANEVPVELYDPI